MNNYFPIPVNPKDRDEWSDAFFNYVPASEAYFKVFNGDEDGPALFHEAAEQFLEIHPTCPYDINWLLNDFSRRY